MTDDLAAGPASPVSPRTVQVMLIFLAAALTLLAMLAARTDQESATWLAADAGYTVSAPQPALDVYTVAS